MSLAKILGGSMGVFRDLDDLRLVHPYLDGPRGFIQQNGRVIELRLLADDNEAGGMAAPKAGAAPPKAVHGWTENGGVALYDPFVASATSAMNGAQLSSKTYSSRLAVSTGRREVRSLSTTEVRMLLPGPEVLRWAGVRTVKRETHTDGRGLVEGMSIELLPTDEETTKLNPGPRVSLRGHWEASGNEESLEIGTMGLSVTCRMNRPTSPTYFLRFLQEIQNLVSLALGEFLPAEQLGFRLLPEDYRAPDVAWSSALMTSPNQDRDAAPLPPHRPFFSLADLGGVAGVRRWSRISAEFPRTVRTVLSPLHMHRLSPEARLLEVASAIETLVAGHRRKTAWAKKGRGKVEPLALHIGPRFDEWCGHTANWSATFWNTYNQIKHVPGYDPKRSDVARLAESGRILLLAFLLQRAGRTNRARDALLANYRLRSLREELQRIVATCGGGKLPSI